MGKQERYNRELASETFMNLGPQGRLRHLTFAERKELELFLQKGVSNFTVDLGSGHLCIDPVFSMRYKRAIEKYGDVVRDIINDIFCGFPEDGLNEEVDHSQDPFETE